MKNTITKTLLLILVVTTACFCSLAQTPKKEKFTPDGGVFFVSGKPPKAFANLGGIALQTIDYKADGTTVQIKPRGAFGAGGRNYKMTNIVYDGKRFSFETVAIGAVSYKFSGEILDNLKYDQEGEPKGDVLKGHLIKFVNGKKTAEADLKFEFAVGVD